MNNIFLSSSYLLMHFCLNVTIFFRENTLMHIPKHITGTTFTIIASNRNRLVLAHAQMKPALGSTYVNFVLHPSETH